MKATTSAVDQPRPRKFSDRAVALGQSAPRGVSARARARRSARSAQRCASWACAVPGRAVEAAHDLVDAMVGVVDDGRQFVGGHHPRGARRSGQRVQCRSRAARRHSPRVRLRPVAARACANAASAARFASRSDSAQRQASQVVAGRHVQRGGVPRANVGGCSSTRK